MSPYLLTMTNKSLDMAKLSVNLQPGILLKLSITFNDQILITYYRNDHLEASMFTSNNITGENHSHGHYGLSLLQLIGKSTPNYLYMQHLLNSVEWA